MKKEVEKNNLTESLNKLNDIVQWFDDQSEIDVEQGLEKVKEAATLIKNSKKRLAEVENEFKEIEKDINIKEEEEDVGEDIPFESDF